MATGPNLGHGLGPGLGPDSGPGIGPGLSDYATSLEATIFFILGYIIRLVTESKAVE